jgi:hypothetical protein
MPDDQPAAYTPAARAAAVLGLFLLGAFAFILADVLSGGKLTGGCTDCADKADNVA